MTTLYGISNCDTIKKARKWLDASGISYEFHDYKKAGCSAELAQSFLGQFPVEQVINKRGTTWRKLPDSTKHALTEALAVRLMQENPSLIKRPILKAGNSWLIGFDQSQWQSTLHNL